MDILLSSLLNMAGVDQDKIKEYAAMIASDDTINKVLSFSRAIDENNAILKDIRDELRRIECWDGSAAEPYPNAKKSGIEQLADSQPTTLSIAS